MRAQRERLDVALHLPFSHAPPKIGLEPCRGLKALLGVLGEELHGDRRQRLGHCSTIVRGCRLARNVAVDPFQWIGGSERQGARQHLVQSDAHRIEIAARIN